MVERVVAVGVGYAVGRGEALQVADFIVSIAGRAEFAVGDGAEPAESIVTITYVKTVGCFALRAGELAGGIVGVVQRALRRGLAH